MKLNECKIFTVNGTGMKYNNCAIKKGIFGITIKVLSENPKEVSIFFPYNNIICISTVKKGEEK